MKRVPWCARPSGSSIRSLVTIDPRLGFIEKMVVDVNLAGLSLVTVTIEVATTNEGIAPSFFEYESHVPAGTPVVLRAPQADEER